MSGICAIWLRDNPGLPAMLAEVGEGLCLTGPEKVSRATDQNAGIAVASRYPTQQLFQNARVLVACDADLHNEEELRDWPIKDEAQVPKSARTAALLAALFERYGVNFVERLRGAFSFLLWDKRERTLVAAIDHFGVNRLAYFEDGHAVLIASRVDALTRADCVDTEVNPRAIANVLNYTSNLGPETILAKVHRVPPGSLLIARDGHVRVRNYWDMRYGLKGDWDESRLSRQLESVVQRSVAARCEKDNFANLGAFLSGGTDSSTIVGLMTRISGGPVKSFSIGFQEQPFNELGYAQIAATRFQSDHHTYLVGPQDCYDALPRMVRSFDEPFGNSSAIPTYFCARLAAENGVKVLLAGDGGDELFGGNERYATDKIFAMYKAVPGMLRTGLIEPTFGRVPIKSSFFQRARGYLRRANLPPIDRYHSFHFLCAHSLSDVFTSDFLNELGSYSVLEIPTSYYSNAPARDHLDRLLYVDLKITLADNDLPKVTCMSELAGIQARFPFLDPSVAEFSGHIPARLKVKGFKKRYLFKRAFRELLPIEIINKKKQGFGIPVAHWLKSNPRMREISRDLLLSTRTFQRGYFQRSFIEELFRRHENDDSTYYGDTLWTLLSMELWHREFVDQPVRMAV